MITKLKVEVSICNHKGHTQLEFVEVHDYKKDVYIGYLVIRNEEESDYNIYNIMREFHRSGLIPVGATPYKH